MIILLVSVIFLLGLFALFTSVHIAFSYKDKYILVVKYGIFTIYKNEKKGYNEERKEEKVEDIGEFELKKIKSIVSKIRKILSEFHLSAKKHFILSKIMIKYIFGFSDAAATGLFSGVAYAVIYSLMGYVDSTFKLKEKDIQIVPDFDNVHQELYFECKCRVKLFYLLKSGIKILRIWLN